MSTHVPGFQSFSGSLHHFELAKLASISIGVSSHQEFHSCRFHFHYFVLKVLRDYVGGLNIKV